MTKTSDYYYDLPQELIAQTPLERRDSSRLMVLNRRTGEITHGIFTDILDYLHPGDVLAVNNSRVMPSRLIGKKEGTDGAIEFLLLQQLGNDGPPRQTGKTRSEIRFWRRTATCRGAGDPGGRQSPGKVPLQGE